MKSINIKVSLLLILVMVVACDNLEMDGLQTDPNNPSPDNASLNDLYNNIQLEFNNTLQSAEFDPGAAARMYMNVAYTYRTMSPNTTFNGFWGNAYNDLFPDIDALLALAEGQNFNIHVGSAKIMKAYTLMLLVDILGDVPLTDAGKGTDVISPAADSGADVYAAAIAMLDDAIVDLTGTNAPRPTFDNFYGGNASGWIKLANTLKLRAALNTGDVATINSLVSGGNLINSATDDFQFNYGTRRANPNSRHPNYTNHYETGDGDYLSNYYMWILKAEKLSVLNPGATVTDPRIRYYFYRKVDDAVDQDATTFSCHFSNLPDQTAKPSHWNAVDPRLPYCIASVDGYTGRDHLNGEGIPPDGGIRTSYGLYPFGGDFDDDTFENTRKSGTTGGLGQGITPFMLSSFTSFMLAEASLRLPGAATGTVTTLLENGIRASLNKVESFENRVSAKMGTNVTLRDGSSGTIKQLYGMSTAKKDDYVNQVLAMYNAAASPAEQLDIVIKEFYIAAWGNGIEAYNMYRRTGYPSNMQPSLEADPGPFPLSFFYPANSVDRNANIDQKGELNVPVFWQDPTVATKLY